MLKRIPPVRRRVPASIHAAPEDTSSLERLAHGYELTFYGSGTQALSRALQLARRDRKDAPRPLEVILPAYGCPDLVAAGIHAGLGIRLVDVCPDSWGYDIGQLRSAFTADTVAVVGVNLLGTGDQRLLLRDLSDAHRCRMIQDSAQYLPDVTDPDWCGDAVILSFGRGKPLNLLHGGALLSRSGAVETHSDSEHESLRSRLLSSPIAAIAFNIATHPGVYPLTSLMPGLKIGGTRYSPLRGCNRLSEDFRRRAARAFSQYRAQENYSAGPWREPLAVWNMRGISLLSCAGDPKADVQYLRLPLLAPSQRIRDSIIARLSAAGLGASSMYGVPLNRVVGIPDAVRRQGPFPGAEALAGRLFTLPTHDSITPAIVERTDQEIRAAVQFARSA
jgi:dTDP-4-amino-4,6-dideoxygalactose transaminase